MDAWMDEWMKVSSKVGSYVSTQRGRVIWGQILIAHMGLWSACAAKLGHFYTSFEVELFTSQFGVTMLTSGLFA